MPDDTLWDFNYCQGWGPVLFEKRFSISSVSTCPSSILLPLQSIVNSNEENGFLFSSKQFPSIQMILVATLSQFPSP